MRIGLAEVGDEGDEGGHDATGEGAQNWLQLVPGEDEDRQVPAQVVLTYDATDEEMQAKKAFLCLLAQKGRIVKAAIEQKKFNMAMRTLPQKRPPPDAIVTLPKKRASPSLPPSPSLSHSPIPPPWPLHYADAVNGDEPKTGLFYFLTGTLPQPLSPTNGPAALVDAAQEKTLILSSPTTHEKFVSLVSDVVPDETGSESSGRTASTTATEREAATAEAADFITSSESSVEEAAEVRLAAEAADCLSISDFNFSLTV